MTDAKALEHYNIPFGHILMKHATKVDASGDPLYTVEAKSRKAVMEKHGFSQVEALPAAPKEAKTVTKPTAKRGRKPKESTDA